MDKRMTYGGNGSHWDGCAEVHWDCKIAQLEAENAALREQVRWRKYPEEEPEVDKLYWTDYGRCVFIGDIWEDYEFHYDVPVKWFIELPQPPEGE